MKKIRFLYANAFHILDWLSLLKLKDIINDKTIIEYIDREVRVWMRSETIYLPTDPKNQLEPEKYRRKEFPYVYEYYNNIKNR